MKKILFFGLSFLIGVFIFFLVIKWVKWQEIREILFTFSYWKWMVIVGVTLLIWFAGIWKWKFILHSQGYNFSLFGLVEIIFAAFAVSYLFPTGVFGGEAFRMYAFKKKLSLSWDKNFAALAIEKLLGLSVILLFLISGAVSFLFLTDSFSKKFITAVIIIISSAIIGLAFFYFKSSKKESIFKWFLELFKINTKKNDHIIQNFEKEVFHFFDFKKKIIWQGLEITFLKNILVLVRCWFLIIFLTGETSIFIALAILFFLQVSYLFPFPAKMGSYEIALAFAFASLGLGMASGITFSFILRGAEVLIALFGLIFLIKLSIKFFIESKLNHLVL